MKFLLLVFGQGVKYRLVVPVPIRVEGVFVAGRDKHAVPVNLQQLVLDFLGFGKTEDGLFRKELVFQNVAVRSAVERLEADGQKTFRIAFQELPQLIHGIVGLTQVFQGFLLEPGSLQAFQGQRDAGIEVPEDARGLGLGDAPYTEKSQHMIDTVSVVELACLGETGFPPGKAVLFNDIPAIGGESPVLAAVAEHVRRGTCAVFQGEVLAVRPHVGAVLVDEDGNVALDVDAELGNL